MKILLADDETNLRNMLEAHLVHSGYEVTAVKDGQEAVDAALSGTYDVMVFDIMMPNRDGVDAAGMFNLARTFSSRSKILMAYHR